VLFSQKFASSHSLRSLSGAGDHDGLQVGRAKKRFVWEQHYLGGGDGERTLACLQPPGCSGCFREVVAGATADEQPCGSTARAIHDFVESGADIWLLQRLPPRFGLRQQFGLRCRVADEGMFAIHRSMFLVEGALRLSFVIFRIRSFYCVC
jgi:hypothetical protein